jgi:hypothetical protein
MTFPSEAIVEPTIEERLAETVATIHKLEEAIPVAEQREPHPHLTGLHRGLLEEGFAERTQALREQRDVAIAKATDLEGQQ